MKNRKRKITMVVAAAIAATVLLSAEGCTGKAAQPYQDAGVNAVNDEKADEITMPDGFSNAATKCDHGNRVYVLFHGDSAYGGIAIVPADPTCS